MVTDDLRDSFDIIYVMTDNKSCGFDDWFSKEDWDRVFREHPPEEGSGQTWSQENEYRR